MTVTETDEREATGTGYYDIGWSADTGLLAIEYADRLFFAKPSAAGDVSEHFPPGWIGEHLPPAGHDDVADWDTPEQEHAHREMILQWEADSARTTQDILAQRTLVTAIVELHNPVLDPPPALSPALEPLPELEAATVSDDDPQDLPGPGGPDDDPGDDDEPGDAA